MSPRPAILLSCLASALSLAAAEVKPDPRIALEGAFPDLKHAKALHGELILVEHVNRQGILRLDRDGTINSYHWDLPHQFHMLPYGSIQLHGAPADLADLPLGTHLHGLFYLGPGGHYVPKVPDSGYTAGKMAAPDMRSVESAWSQVLRLQDDFSFYEEKGEGWKITAFGPGRANVTLQRVTLRDGRPARPNEPDDGILPTMTVRISPGTRVWKGRQIATLEDLAEGQVVQVNFHWLTLLGSTKEHGMCREVWIDEESRQAAREQQRQAHIASMKIRGLPATILKTESMPGEGARGHLTFAFHAGIDPALIAAFQPKSAVLAWAAEPTLRVHDGLNDAKPLGDLEITRIEQPPPGHSGVQVRAHCWEMIEGFRAGRTIRLALKDWNPPHRPREELMWPNDTRVFHVAPKPVADRGPEAD